MGEMHGADSLELYKLVLNPCSATYQQHDLELTLQSLSLLPICEMDNATSLTA